MATIFKRNSSRKAFYYYSYYDEHGKRRTKSSKTTDKSAAERIAKKAEADAALRRENVIDPTLQSIGEESQRPIAEHLEGFEAKLRTANRTDKHIKRTLQCIRSICNSARFKTPNDIQANGVTSFAAKLLKQDGKSLRTVEAHLTAMKSFTKWLTENDKLNRDPLAGKKVEKPDPENQRSYERRALLPDEWPWLRMATAGGPERYDMAAHERLLLYRTAIQTGLRSGELRILTRGSLAQDSEGHYIMVKSRSTKNRKPAKQYIQADLAADLSAHLAGKMPKAGMFQMPHEANVARMLRADLAAARGVWLKEAVDDPEEYTRRDTSHFLVPENEDDETFDFHCLRHTCGAWLAMAGTHPKVIQKVMRHSTITLTMDTYGHLFPGEHSSAINTLQGVMGDAPAALRATGTDGDAIGADDSDGDSGVLRIRPNDDSGGDSSAQRICKRAGWRTMQSGATGRDEPNKAPKEGKQSKSLQDATLRDTSRDDANTPRRIRTSDLRIRSAALALEH